MVKVPKLKPALDFRRSVTKDKISTPIAIPNKHPPPSILPPKKVIKALYDYNATSAEELSFSKGDFFHVVGDENNPEWYEACNPATNTRGFVPVSYFQVLEKSGRLSGGDKIDPDAFYDSALSGQKPQPLYGSVLYDFIAERPDELNAKAGEPIIVIAQSNHEWFVAKPIGRLGGPGLIPVSFVEIRDHSTGKAIENVQELMDNSVVPKVEEWKKMTQDYQESSISLGRLDFAGDSKLAPVGLEADPKLAPVAIDPKLVPINRDYDSKLAPMGPYGYTTDSTSDTLTMNSTHQSNSESLRNIIGEIVTASVESYHFEDGRYWFFVCVELTSGRYRNLYRLYEDFYDFQIALLNEFPVEAGRTGERRILPFMPGPLSYVNDTITSQRRADLDVYIKELLNLPNHVLRHPLLEKLFGLQGNDVETPYDPRNDTRTTDANGRNETNILDALPIDPTQTMDAFHDPHQQNVVRKQTSLSSIGFKRNNEPFSPPGQQQTSMHQDPQNGRSNVVAPKQSTPSPESIKIKISYNNDIVAIRVPSNVSYAALREKLYGRLNVHATSLQYEDKEGVTRKIEGDIDLRSAIANTPKLFIHAS